MLCSHYSLVAIFIEYTKYNDFCTFCNRGFMTKCKHWENRYIPIEYSKDCVNQAENYFSLCLIKKGTAVVCVDGENCYISAPALLCVNPDIHVKILKSKNLQLKTVSFSPDFINRNLSTDRILSDDYDIKCRLFDFPSFVFFYKNDDIYNCIIPIEVNEIAKVEYLFDNIEVQLTIQPDNMWSCRARMAVIRILDYALSLYNDFNIAPEEDTLVDCILTFIEFNFDKNFTIEDLCHMYNTNRTTLMSEFKRVTSKTINEFITDKRIDLCKQILAFTNIPIEEVALKHGFSSQAYFTRAFKKKTGMSPLQYRKESLKKRIQAFQSQINNK